MPALVLESGQVHLRNVACGTEGVAIMQSDMAVSTSTPAAGTCGALETLNPMSAACMYSVANTTLPVSISAAKILVSALGKRILSFASEAEYNAVRQYLSGTRTAYLLASGILRAWFVG
jgi:hypothetical protein